MSMRDLGGYPTLSDDASGDLEASLEEEIARELSKLGDEDLDVNDEDDEHVLVETSVEDKQTDLLPSMEQYVLWIQGQTKNLEAELEECDDLLQHADIVSSRQSKIPEEDYLVELAQKEGLDVQTFKEKILDEISKQDQEDEKYLKEADFTSEAQHPHSDEAAVTIPNGWGSTNGPQDPDVPNPNVPSNGVETGSGETINIFDHTSVDINENIAVLKQTIVDDPSVMQLQCSGSNGAIRDTGSAQESNQITLQPGQGVVAEITEADLLEKQLWRQLKAVEDKGREKEQNRKQKADSRKAEEEKKQSEADEHRRKRLEIIQQEEKQLKLQQQETDNKLKQESEESEKKIQQSLQVYEKDIEEFSTQLTREQSQFVETRKHQEQQSHEKNRLAAVRIQASYRGHRVRKEHGKELKDTIDEMKTQRENARIREIENERKARLDKEKYREEVRQMKQEEERKIEEIKAQKLEAEKKRLEEAEQKKQEELRKKEEAEEKKRQEQRKKEEEKKRQEEEKRIQEQERKRKAAEQQRLKEEVKQRKAEEKRRKEEEERMIKEATLKEVEERRKLEEENIRKAAMEKEALNQKENDIAVVDESTPVTHAQSPNNLVKTEQLQAVEGGHVSETVPAPNTAESSSQPVAAVAASKSSPVVPIPPSSSDSRPQSARRSRQGYVAVRKSRAFLTSVHPPKSWGEHLPVDLEKKRQNWIKDCMPWSKVLGELRTRRPAMGKKPPKRPVSGKNLPLLDTGQILSAACASTLQQVTTVELHDLPGCSIKPLAQCQQLKYLAMHNCRLVTTEGLEFCKALEYVDLQNNDLQVVNVKDLNHMTYLDLSDNAIVTVHGLDGCTKLMYLNLSHNRITRIGGLDHLQSLHTLNLSHNQLITSRELSAVPTLQVLDLSSNHLPTLEEVNKLGLLQVLNVAGNNIMELPTLQNHVLLHKLVLTNNNITSLMGVVDGWLPTLHCLEMEQNGLTSFPEMMHCLLLEDLNICNNQMLELSSLIPGLVSLRHLKTLKADGNPVVEEKDWSDVVEDKLPHVSSLDDIKLSQTQPPLSHTKYENMCQEQLRVHSELLATYTKALNSVKEIAQMSAIHTKYFTQSYSVATEQRYTHEYGEISSQQTYTVDMNFTPSLVMQKDNETKSDTLDMKSKFQASLTSKSSSVQPKSEIGVSTVPMQLEVDSPLNQLPSDEWKSKFDAALERSVPGSAKQDRSTNNTKTIQKESQVETTDNKAKFDALFKNTSPKKDSPVVESKLIPANTVGNILKHEGIIPKHSSAEVHTAATKIQALWRGFILRKRLTNALNYARNAEEEDEMDFDEIDLDAFNFDENDLEKDWIVPDMPQLPANHAVLKRPLAGQTNKPPHPPDQPRNAWKTKISPPRDQVNALSGKPPLPPLSRMSDRSADTLTDGGHTHRSKMSRKEEKITEEWGFRDQRTAEIMLARAKKLKYNADKKRKIGQLDPKQRLALFRKLEENAKNKPVNLAPRRGAGRKDYFQARQEEETRAEQEKIVEYHQKEARTYEWLHSQVGHHEVTSSRIQNRELEKQIQAQGFKKPGFYNSEGNLPRMDASILAGGRALLTGSPVSIELQSIESTSITGELPKPRRLSMTDSAGEHLPPIKTSSAPSARPNEKMSWRSPNVEKSVGWGGGKKRGSRP